MKKELSRQIFSYVFLFIFFAKMIISIAPLIASHMDSKIVNAVIMQLEIENHSSKDADTAKDSLNKGEWLSGICKFNFCQPYKVITSQRYSTIQDYHIRSFYPSVPTPPPNS